MSLLSPSETRIEANDAASDLECVAAMLRNIFDRCISPNDYTSAYTVRRLHLLCDWVHEVRADCEQDFFEYTWEEFIEGGDFGALYGGLYDGIGDAMAHPVSIVSAAFGENDSPILRLNKQLARLSAAHEKHSGSPKRNAA